MSNTTAQKEKIVHKSIQLTPPPSQALGSTVELTPRPEPDIQRVSDILKAQGVQLGYSSLERKAYAKYVSNCIAVTILNKVPQTKLRKGLLRTLGCCQNLKREGNKIKNLSMYCNCRWCLTCSHIRTAVRIDAYYEQLCALPDKQFIILSQPNVPGYMLRKSLQSEYAALRKIKKAAAKKGIKLQGLRNWECTHNKDANTYHPHWGFIISGKRDAEFLLYEWLKHFPKARRGKGNKIFEFDDTGGERALMELFKYQTKLLVPIKNKKGKMINADALNTIFEACVKLRTFQPMGIKAAKEITDDINDSVKSVEYKELPDDGTIMDLEFFGHDWYDTATGELLTGFDPSSIISQLIPDD
jgi:hypothetical protein